MPTDEIIIVGNGPSLLEKSLGDVIDSYPNVVRFNKFQIEGYQKQVGTKTTIWSKWYGVTDLLITEDLERIWLNMPISDRSEERLAKAKEILGEYKSLLEVIPDFEVVSNLQIELYGKLDSNFWPSSGLLAIVHAIHKGYLVTITGIDSWSHEPFHYYEKHDRTKSPHDPVIERAYISKLLCQGLINII